MMLTTLFPIIEIQVCACPAVGVARMAHVRLEEGATGVTGWSKVPGRLRTRCHLAV